MAESVVDPMVTGHGGHGVIAQAAARHRDLVVYSRCRSAAITAVLRWAEAEEIRRRVLKEEENVRRLSAEWGLNAGETELLRLLRIVEASR